MAAGSPSEVDSRKELYCEAELGCMVKRMLDPHTVTPFHRASSIHPPPTPRHDRAPVNITSRRPRCHTSLATGSANTVR